MSPETKLYRHRCTGRCPDRWSKFPTNQEEYDDTEETVSKDPIVHRHIFSDHKWVTESFTVNSPAMQVVLSTVLEKYQDLDLELEKWTFKPPFMPLVHRRDRLLSLCDYEDKEPIPETWTQLLKFLTPILAPKVDALVRTRKTGNVIEARSRALDRGDQPKKPDKAEKSEKINSKRRGCDGWGCDDGSCDFCRDEGEDDNDDTDTSEEHDTLVVEGNAKMTVKAPNDIAGRSETLEDLTDDMCLVATPWLKGFDLKTKEWAQFYVDDITPVVWNDAAFNHLALPGTDKQLAWEFVENKTLANSFDDFIQDKDRGIIILMFGPPGVGKTYTAEEVAEKARVPLYSMSAGDLGTVPKEVELALERALTPCGLWNSMLLLEEADVFLGARTDSDLARNELVAGRHQDFLYLLYSRLTNTVFLTKLEYYTGVCFLTTNRTASIDAAFQSRVDLFLPYKDLTFEARKKVWQNFINRAGGTQVEIPEEEMGKLAEMKLNGREIKNLTKSSHLLGLKNGGVIQVDRLLMLAQNRVAALGELKNN
ncbi:hypothetical protein LZL87_009708 [Fusarium oxysporum]|nr:hypothetical protein LZL87_009708 [Fusarium oxysporum]